MHQKVHSTTHVEEVHVHQRVHFAIHVEEVHVHQRDRRGHFAPNELDGHQGGFPKI